MTGEARLELQAKRRAAGVELTGLIGTWGVGSMALASSSGSTQGVTEQGQLLKLGMERSTPVGGGTLQFQRTSQSFAPFGEATGPLVAAQRARESWLATVGGVLWASVTGGLSYVSQTRWNSDNLKTAGLFLSLPLWQRASMSLSMSRRLDGDRNWRAGVSLIMTLDQGIQTVARTDLASAGKPVGMVSALRNAPAGPGLGWRADVSSVPSQRARAGLQYNTSNTELALDIAADAKGQVAALAGVRGSFGLLAGVPFASRTVGQGSFAVVEVEGIAGVPVKRSHQVVAQTDSRGLAFVPGLLPWQINEIEIDPADLPMDTTVGAAVLQITPYAASGSILKFGVKRSRQALLVLHTPDGQPVPIASRVQLIPAGPVFLVGRRGEVWLTDLAYGQQRLQVSWPKGGCELVLPVTGADGEVPAKIGPLSCGKN